MENTAVETEVMSVISVVPDPLKGNHRKHRLNDMLFASIISVICGFNSYRCFERFVSLNLDWLRRHGCAFSNGVPDSNSFQYLFAHLDPGLLSACLRSVAGKLRERTDMEIVSFDGKALRFLSNVQVCKCASGQFALVSASTSVVDRTCVKLVLETENRTLPACTFSHFHTEGRGALYENPALNSNWSTLPFT